MSFYENEDIALLRKTLQDFLEKELPLDKVRNLDKEADFCRETFDKLSQLGVNGVTIPEEYGGIGIDLVAAVAIIEELGQRGTSLAGPFTHCAFYGGMNIVENGSEEQKRTLLPKLAKGELLFAYALSEPDVGGDLASARVTARRKGDSVIINGTKRWCTGARISDYIYTLVRSGDVADRYNNLSFIMVSPDMPGITIKDIDHMGLRYAKTTDVIFDDVEVPFENVVGGPEGWNKGWQMLVGRALDVERLETSAITLGIAKEAMDYAWQYSQERKQFGKPICAHQAVRHQLVDAKTKLVACQHMLYNAAWIANQGRNCSVETSMAKLFIADTAVEIVLACQQVLGAYGCSDEYHMERCVRDILCMPIVGGSSNMQKNNIANRLMLPTR